MKTIIALVMVAVAATAGAVDLPPMDPQFRPDAVPALRQFEARRLERERTPADIVVRPGRWHQLEVTIAPQPQKGRRGTQAIRMGDITILETR